MTPAAMREGKGGEGRGREGKGGEGRGREGKGGEGMDLPASCEQELRTAGMGQLSTFLLRFRAECAL